MALELAQELTTADLLQASVILLAFAFLVPRKLLHDPHWGTPGQRYAAGYIFAGVVFGLALSATGSLLGSRAMAAQSLLFSLASLAILAFLQVNWIADLHRKPEHEDDGKTHVAPPKTRRRI